MFVFLSISTRVLGPTHPLKETRARLTGLRMTNFRCAEGLHALFQTDRLPRDVPSRTERCSATCRIHNFRRPGEGYALLSLSKGL
jgi:hypothetical protein